MSSIRRNESTDLLLSFRLTEPVEILVKVDEIKPGHDYIKVTSHLKMLVGQDSAISEKTGILVLIKSDIPLNGICQGDNMWLRGKLNEIKPTRFPFEVDWFQHYINKGIHYTMFVKQTSDILIVKNQQFGIKTLASDLSKKMQDLIEKNKWTNQSKQIVKAMLLGDKNGMSGELKDTFSKSGVIHVLAVSGLHVGIIFLFVRSILLLFGINKNYRFIYATILIISIWFYALVTGLASSVTRASFMFSLITFGEALRRKSSIYNTLACSAFFILLINPERLYDLGFLLSYTAVLGIVSIFPILKVLIYNENIFIEKIWSALSVSLSAQIGTLPLVLKTFNVFPVYFLAANLIAIPLTGVIIVFSLIHLTIQSINSLEFFSTLTAIILELLIHYLFIVLSFISSLPYSTIDINLNNIQFLLLTAMVCFLVYSMYQSKRRVFIASFYLIPLVCLLADGGPFSEKTKNQTYFINYKNNLFIGRLRENDHVLLPLTDDSLIIDEVLEKVESYYRKRGSIIPEIDYAFKVGDSNTSLIELTFDEEKHLLICKTMDDSTLSALVGNLSLRSVIFIEYPDISLISLFKHQQNISIILPSFRKDGKYLKMSDSLMVSQTIWQPEYKDYLVLLNPVEE